MIKIKHFRIPAYFAEFVADLPKREQRKPDNDMLLPYSRHDKSFVPMTKGGQTVIEWTDNPDEVIPLKGIANCSLQDNYNYALGRRIAAGRLDKLLAETYGVLPTHPDREKLKELMR